MRWIKYPSLCTVSAAVSISFAFSETDISVSIDLGMTFIA